MAPSFTVTASGARGGRGAGTIMPTGRTCHVAPCKGPPVPACCVADGCNEHPEHEQYDDQHHHQGHEQDHDTQNDILKGGGAVVRLRVAAIVVAAARKADPVDVCNGTGHIVGTGGHGTVVVAGSKVVFHGLGEGTGLTFQRGVAEAVAVGHVVIAILVDGRLHHQQDQHTVVLGSRADAPGVEGLCCIILSGIITRIIYSQYADLCPVAALFQLGIQVDDGLGGAVAQNVGVIHHTLISGQVRQAGGGKCRRSSLTGYNVLDGRVIFQPLFYTFHVIFTCYHCLICAYGSETGAFVAVYPPFQGTDTPCFHIFKNSV